MTIDKEEEEQDRSSKPFIEHLEDLRKTLIGSITSLVVGMAIAIPLAPKVMEWLKQPLQKATGSAEPFLRSLDVAGGFNLAMRLIFWTGLLLSAPFILFFVGSFVFPGLTQKEKTAVKRSSLFAAVLFFCGVMLGYKMTLPVALEVMMGLHTWLGIRAEWVVNSYVSFSLQLLLAFGLVFELPVVLLILGHIGIVNSTQLREKRRVVIIILLIVAMLLTPPDIFTQLIMGIPLIVLYEACIWMIWAAEKRRAQQSANP